MEQYLAHWAFDEKDDTGCPDLIYILIRSQGQISTLAPVHFTIIAKFTKFIQDIQLTLGHSHSVWGLDLDLEDSNLWN